MKILRVLALISMVSAVPGAHACIGNALVVERVSNGCPAELKDPKVSTETKRLPGVSVNLDVRIDGGEFPKGQLCFGSGPQLAALLHMEMAAFNQSKNVGAQDYARQYRAAKIVGERLGMKVPTTEPKTQRDWAAFWTEFRPMLLASAMTREENKFRVDVGNETHELDDGHLRGMMSGLVSRSMNSPQGTPMQQFLKGLEGCVSGGLAGNADERQKTMDSILNTITFIGQIPKTYDRAPPGSFDHRAAPQPR